MQTQQTLSLEAKDGYRYKLVPFSGEAGIETALLASRLLLSLFDGKKAGIEEGQSREDMAKAVLSSLSTDQLASTLSMPAARPVIQHLASCTTFQTEEMAKAQNGAWLSVDDWSEHFRGRLPALTNWLIEGLRWQLSPFFGFLANRVPVLKDLAKGLG